MSSDYPKKMKAAVTKDWGKIEVEEVDVPFMGDDEVLCRVRSCGICGTDPHILKGELKGFGWPPGFPFIQGHEWTGEVVSAGKDVERFSAGDRVIGETAKGCGTCDWCKRGRYNLCVNFGKPQTGFHLYGHDTNGAFAEYVVRPPIVLHKMPEGMSFEEGVMMAQVIISLHTVERPGVLPTDTSLTIGPGTIGLLTFQISKAFGADRTIVAGRGYRLEMAKAYGADEVIDIEKEDLPKRVLELTGGRGADVVYETAGNEKAAEWAFQCAAMGGRVALCGVTGDKKAVPVVTDMVALREIDVYGIRGGPNAFPASIALVHSGKINVKDLVTHQFPLDEVNEAFDTVLNRKGGALKVAINP